MYIKKSSLQKKIINTKTRVARAWIYTADGKIVINRQYTRRVTSDFRLMDYLSTIKNNLNKYTIRK